MLKLKLQHFGHLMQRSDSLEETLMMGKIEDKRIKGQQRTRWLDSGAVAAEERSAVCQPEMRDVVF